MKLSPCGAGLHVREVQCAEALKAALPEKWYAYSNLELVLGRGITREVDLVIVADHYIFVIDVKDWYGTVESREGNWFQNGKDRGGSPVKKIAEIQRKVFEKLQGHLKSRKDTRELSVPRVIGLVLMAGRSDCSGISDLEKDNVLDLELFIRIANSPNKLRDNFGNVPFDHVKDSFSGRQWKQILTRFFNVKSSPFFQPGQRRFQGLLAQNAPTFVHPNGIYSEFDAYEEKIPLNTSTLRLWDFAKCENSRFQTEEGRSEIAGREKSVFHWLRDRNSFTEKYLLTPAAHDVDSTVDYWEAYERRQKQKRLSDFVLTEAERLSAEERLEMSRQLLAAVASLHESGAAHLDLGPHSIWMEVPTTVRLSHLMAAHTPEGRSLGIDRYQFLSSVTLPEIILDVHSSPQRRDVFLVGVAVHSVLFGHAPEGNPPDWNSNVDLDNCHANLHGWFSAVLEHDPNNRIRTCSDALSLFNKATATSPSSTKIIEKIEIEHSPIKSQMQAARMFPLIEDFICETNALEAWITEHAGRKLLVKMWKQAAIGDLGKNSPKILSFLEQAKNMIADQPKGIAPIRHYSWLSDAIILTQEWIEGVSLEEYLECFDASKNRTAIGVLKLSLKLLNTIESLHDQNISHGDLKPSNVVVNDDNEVFLVDVLDLQLEADSGYSLSDYAPDAGDRFERDRYAAIKICLEVLNCSADPISEIEGIKECAELCIRQEPALATLIPFQEKIIDQINEIENPVSPADEVQRLDISIRNAGTGPIEPDEGHFFFRHRVSRNRDIEFIHLRGANEELMIALSPDWEVQWAKRQKVSQENLIRNEKSEFFRCELHVSVQENTRDSFGSLSNLIERYDLRNLLRNVTTPSAVETDDELVRSTDDETDALVEKAAAEKVSVGEGLSPSTDVDVPELWKKLIDVESQLSIEGDTTADSWFDERLKMTAVPFSLDLGQIEFDREDTVLVEKETKAGRWAKIGQLDVRQSRRDCVYVDSFWEKASLRIEAGTRLRFESFFTSESLKRRKDAVDKVLQGSGRTADLVSAFDPQRNSIPTNFSWVPDNDLIASYQLNEEQELALRGVISKRPLSLVQGPPGTGKTRFIAALAHYALTHGLARSVLLSSQSHEAVNTAIEGVIKHFANEGEKPSVFRVGANTVDATGELQQYFARNLEQSLKDRFSASFKDRIRIAGKSLGVPEDISDKICVVETTINDMVSSIERLSMASRDPNDSNKRKHNLLMSLEQQIASVIPEGEVSTDDNEMLEVPNAVVSQIIKLDCRPIGLGDDKIEKLREIIRLAKDFIGASSSVSRSFEPFFAGTRQIVAGTCVGLGRRSLGLTTTPFDLVIVDEAARCTASELLVPLQASRWTVMVGDHAQLQPHHEPAVVERVSRELKLKRSDILVSDFERVFCSPYAETGGFSLQRQYRMLPAINQIVSKTFYPGLNLSAGRHEPVLPPSVLEKILENEVAWVETDSLGKAGYETSPKGSSSKVNEAEADAIVGLIEKWVADDTVARWLESQTDYEAGIGVICMYAAQRDLLKRKLNMSCASRYLNKGLKVGTVDSYQGKENPIVILSLVRNNKNGLVVNGERSIREGFLIAPNRINVAFSRAMDRLFIVGNRNAWRPGTPIASAASEFSELASQGRATVISADTLIDRSIGNVEQEG